MSRPRSRSDLLVFLALAFGGSWLWAGAFFAAGVHLHGGWTFLVSVPYMLFPALGAVVAEKRRGANVRETLAIRFSPNGWWLAGSLGALLFAWMAFGFSLAMPGTEMLHSLSSMLDKFVGKIPPEKLLEARKKLDSMGIGVFLGLTSLQALGFGATVNAVAALGEELGWRGYLHASFERFGFWKRALIVGLVWGPWHWPLVLQGHNYPQHPLLGLAMMTVFTVALAPLFAAVREYGRSTVAAAITHGTVNAAAGFGAMFVKGGSDLTVGVAGIAGAIALALMNVTLFLWMRSRPLPAPSSAPDLAQPTA